jgi:hypothetical protein
LRTLLGHFCGVIVPRDTTDRAVLLGIAVHTQQIVSIVVVPETITEKSPVSQLRSVVVNPLFCATVPTQEPLNGRTQLVLITFIERYEAERLQIRRDGLPR